MKSYTDLEQSKKLAELLPVESADGYWFKGFPPQPYMVYTKGTYNPGEHIPCWSLAALLNYIKDKCGHFELVYFNLYRLSTDVYDVHDDNLINACVTMIEELHKQKLL